MKLAALVRKYKRDCAPAVQHELEYFRNLRSLEQVIRHAVQGIGSNGKMHDHQHRLGYELLGRQSEILVNHKDEIRKTKSFDELYQLVYGYRLYGVGALGCYDACVRIGAYLNLYPSVVYLHAGTLRGYRSLGFKSSGGTVELERLPKAFHSLSPSDLENFLCVMKRVLENNGNGSMCGQGHGAKKRGIC